MILRSMTADFGRLQGEKLTLQPGLNVIEAPNESGKSTWCAFLRCMLYGVNTAQREKAGTKPDKVLYVPWSGAPMAGSVNLEYQGREYTIQRTTQRASAPMAELSAVYAGTARPAAELLQGDLGERLTGVSESVFERTAFIGSASLAVSNGAELEKRIASMISSGEEGVSFSEASAQLQSLQRSLRFRSRGRLPEIEEEAKQIKNTLSAIGDAAAEWEQQENRAAEVSARLEQQRRETEEAFSSRRAELGGKLAFQRETLQTAHAEREEICSQLDGVKGRLLPRLIPGILLLLAGIALRFFGAPLWSFAVPVSAGLLAADAFFLILSVRGAKAEAKRRQLQERLAETDFTLRAAEGKAARLEQQMDELDAETEEQRDILYEAQREAQQAAAAAGLAKGRLSALGDKTLLETKLRALAREHRTLERRYAALELALDELAEADKEMQNIFSPAISREAGHIFEKLTGQRYEELTFSRDLHSLARRKGDTVSHADAFLSRGTADQLYLALRLALCKVLLPEEEACPIVLDDALINFDDERMGYALDLLSEMAQTRQILLFTCHSREKRYLASKLP